MTDEKASRWVPNEGMRAIDLMPWAVFAALLVIGGLLLAARAGDDYMSVSGLLFAGFGVLMGFRLLRRTLP